MDEKQMFSVGKEFFPLITILKRIGFVNQLHLLRAPSCMVGKCWYIWSVSLEDLRVKDLRSGQVLSY
jgi:hypothetical protein